MYRLLKYAASAMVALTSVPALPAVAAPAETAWPVPDWQTASPGSQNMAPQGVDHVRDWLKEHGSKTGVLVRHGRIVGEWYFDDAKPDSRFLVYSTTKSFSSTAAGLAIAEGKFKLDTKIGAVLGGVDLEEKRNITVRDLLSMTSGVHNNPQINTREDLFHYALIDAPLDHQPGTFWDYNNTGLAILSPVIARATRQQIDELLSEKVFKPIGIRQADWSWERRNSLTIPYSGLEITARGLARYGLLFLNRGKWQEQQIVPAAWVAEATGPSQKMNKSYGYLWWNNTDGKWRGVPSDAFASLGRFDNSMLIVPSLDLIVLRQVGDDTGHDRKIDIGELWRLAVESVKAEPPK